MWGLTAWTAVVFFAVVGGLFALVALQMVTGRIDLEDLLLRKGRMPTFSPERAQLLVFTLAAGFYELHAIVVARGDGGLPDLPAPWLVVLGGSNALYLFRKHRAG